MFAALFGAFLLQIFTRYILNNPTAWTQELTLVLYIWVVFWTCAFLLRERDHITFDLIALSLPMRGRRVLAAASTALVVLAFAAAISPVTEYVTFMKIDRTPVLGIRFDIAYSIFLVFMAAVIVAGLVRLLRLWGSGWRREIEQVSADHPEAGP